MSDVRVRAFDGLGQQIGAGVEVWDHAGNVSGVITHTLVAFRKKRWLVFEMDPPMMSPIPEKVITRLWLGGYEPMEFPTLAAVRAYLVLTR